MNVDAAVFAAALAAAVRLQAAVDDDPTAASGNYDDMPLDLQIVVFDAFAEIQRFIDAARAAQSNQSAHT